MSTDKLEQVLICVWEILDARDWGNRTHDPWSVQVEVEWAQELRYTLGMVN